MSGGEPAARIDYYTDPLCGWSWALEPVWREIRRRHDVSINIVLGGMVETLEALDEPITALWRDAARETGVAIDTTIWQTDPPLSSFPASIGVKAALLQSADAGERYLSIVREAVMTRRLNVARPSVLRQLARELAFSMPRAFDVDRFDADLLGDEAVEAFRDDLARARFERIETFPTIIVQGETGSRTAVGYRSIDVIEALLAAVSEPCPGPSRLR